MQWSSEALNAGSLGMAELLKWSCKQKILIVAVLRENMQALMAFASE
jgi:hypothetical protein